MTRRLAFQKYHGCGNDFIIIDEMRGRTTPDGERSRLAKMLTDRHFGIGADGLIFIERAKGADGSMRLFEPAGNEADMCGNGMRCVGAYIMEKLGKDSVDVLSKDGLKKVVRAGRGYSVEMGVVRTTGHYLKKYYTGAARDSDSMMRVRIRAGRRYLTGALVNSGEPHFVTRTADLEPLRVRDIGDTVNADRKSFPLGVNLNFVQATSSRSIRIRTYERGVYDETLACGTGATASAAVSLMLGWVRAAPVTVVTKGGAIRIALMEDGTAVMSGPAVRVYEGVLELPSRPGRGLSCS
jgi:diaminopimelate epimerase